MYIPMKVHASLDPVMEGPRLVVSAVDVGFLFCFCFLSFAKSIEISIVASMYFVFGALSLYKQ